MARERWGATSRRPARRARTARAWRVVGVFIALAAGVAHAQVAETDRLTQATEDLFGSASRLGEFGGQVPAAPVQAADRILGYVARSADIARIPAYSGEPIEVLVGVDLSGRMVGVEILHHAEPILLAGVSEDDLRAYVAQYSGVRALDKIKIGGQEREGYVTIDGLTGATITAMVLNATVTRTARQLAASRDLPLHSDAQPAPVLAAHSAGSLWIEVWQDRRFRIVVLALGLLALAAILVFQDWLTRHPSLLKYVRTGYLVYALVFIGWYGLAQLSVINVLTFSHALMGRFDWSTFLIDPMMFILWSFVALTLLLWGRGVYCGWLCAFGALQELVNSAARKLGLVQLPIPAVVHERLLAIKYIILVALFGLSLHSMVQAVRFAEVEPFKTAINMHWAREWQFVLYAGALVVVSAFNGKFFCKYLCPLGAALTIPSHFRIFDWLRRRKECGRPCQTCAHECPSQAIRPTGEIDANECHHCLDCQVTYWNDRKCPPLVERRKRREKRAGGPA